MKNFDRTIYTFHNFRSMCSALHIYQSKSKESCLVSHNTLNCQNTYVMYVMLMYKYRDYHNYICHIRSIHAGNHLTPRRQRLPQLHGTVPYLFGIHIKHGSLSVVSHFYCQPKLQIPILKYVVAAIIQKDMCM